MRCRLPLFAVIAAAGLAPAASAQDGSAHEAMSRPALTHHRAEGAPHRAAPAKTTAGSAGVLTQPNTSPTSVTGPSTPTTNEPGDNEPVLVIGGAVVGTLALVGAFLVARTRVRDDPQ